LRFAIPEGESVLLVGCRDGALLEALKPFEEDGLVVMESGKITIVGAGRLLLRNIAMCFDAYLDSMIKTKPVFSRTV